MAGIKMRAYRMMTAAAWLGIGTAVLVTAYAAAGAAAHLGTYVSWR